MKKLYSDKVCIFLACNRDFSRHLRVVINSIRCNTSSKIHLFLWVRDSETKAYFKQFLKPLESDHFSFDILIFDFIEKLTSFSYTHPPEACFRLFLGSKIPKDISRIIYLDSDIVVNHDISLLYGLKFKTCIAGAVDYYWSKYSINRLKSKGFFLTKYINSGVLIINLKLWRELNFDQKIFDFLQKNYHTLNFIDQDALNIVLCENISIIDTAWNHTLLFWKPIPFIKWYIFHFLGPRKPDHYLYPNIKSIKLFNLYDGNSMSFSYKLLINFCYIFFSAPWSFFMFAKSKFLYRFSSINIVDYFSLFFILHPFVFCHFCKEIYTRFKRTWWKWLYVRIWEFF